MNTSASIHEEAELWASAASTGGLTEPELKAWNDHIAVCPACKKLNEEELAMARLIKQKFDAASPDPGFEQRILLKLENAGLGNRNRWYEYFLFRPVLATAAACIALLAIAGIGTLVHNGKPVAANTAPGLLDGLPVAVRAAIQREADGQAINGIEHDEEDGETVYAVETKAPDGSEKEFEVSGDGTLLSIGTTLAEVPQGVRDAIKNQIAQGSLAGIDETFDDGATEYVATISYPDGHQQDFTFAPDGMLQEVETAFAELPEPIQSAIKAQKGQGRLEGIDETFGAGEAEYVATITSPDGRERDFTFGADGTLSSMEVTQDELPAAVQTAVRDQVGQGRLGGIDKTFDNGETEYVATITLRDGRERDFTFSADGTLSSVEVTQDELPAAVQTAVYDQVGEGRLDGIDKTFDAGRVTYDGTIIGPDGRERDFSISEQGKLLSREVAMNEAPEAVQQTISRTLGNGKVIEIDQSFEEASNVVPYEIEGRRDGKPVYFLVSPTGSLLGMED